MHSLITYVVLLWNKIGNGICLAYQSILIGDDDQYKVIYNSGCAVSMLNSVITDYKICALPCAINA